MVQHFLVVHRGVGGDSGLYYTCAVWNDYNKPLEWCPRKPMYRSTNAGPALALFNNTIYCVYADPDGYLKCTTWPKMGTAWTADTYVQDSSKRRCRSADRTPALVTSADGKTLNLIYVGWGTTQLYSCTSSDGTTWTLGAPVTNCSTEAGVAGVIYDSTLYIAFPTDAEGYTDQILSASYDPQYGWSAALSLSSNPPMSCSTPSLAVFNGTLYMAHRGKTDNESIWTSTLNNSGPGSSLALASTDTPCDNQSADGPALVATSWGRLWCLHRSWGTEDDADLYGALWTGSTWMKDVRIHDEQTWYEPAVLSVDSWNVFKICCGSGPPPP